MRQQFLDRQFRDQVIFAKAKYHAEKTGEAKMKPIREIVQESLIKFYGVAPGPDKAAYPPPWKWMMR